MATVRVCDLSGKALDWCVAKIEGTNSNIAPTAENPRKFFTFAPEYSSYWADGGPIIERESIQLTPAEDMESWYAGIMFRQGMDDYKGQSPLIAAMRCYVASKLGGVVEVPEELLS